MTVTTKNVAEGVTLDFDSEGRLAGIEILDAVHRFGDKETFNPTQPGTIVGKLSNSAAD